MSNKNPLSIRMFEFLNGKEAILDEVHGKFKHSFLVTRYPIEGETRHMLVHEATPSGKRSRKYQEHKGILGDDWITDLTDSDMAMQFAISLGFKYDEEVEKINKGI